jgi:hypothetical protein
MFHGRRSLFRPVRCVLSRLAIVRHSWNCGCSRRTRRLRRQRRCQYIALSARRLHGDWGDHGSSVLARRLRTLKMETAGKTRTTSRGRLISIVVIAFAVALAVYAFHESNTHPTSSDSSIDADVVHVAATVGGRIIQLPVVENMRVAEGSLLFQIDPLPYRLAVEQTAACPRDPALNRSDRNGPDEESAGEPRPGSTFAGKAASTCLPRLCAAATARPGASRRERYCNGTRSGPRTGGRRLPSNRH